MHTCMPTNSISDGPITNLLSILCVLTELLSGANATEKIGLNDFKFATFIGRFPSEGAASMAVKGLMFHLIVRERVTRQCPQTTAFEQKGEPKQIRTEVPLLN